MARELIVMSVLQGTNRVGADSTTVTLNDANAATSFWRTLFPTARATLIAIVVCVAVPALLIGLQISANREFSPFDEAAHLDYVERITQGEVPRQGDKMLESSMRAIACNGYQRETFDHLPGCDAPAGSWTREMTWNQHEAQQPPTYYAITVPLRWISHNVFGVADDLQATRTTSIAWLVVGLALLWATGRLMRLSPYVIGAVLLLLAASPWILYLSATVSNDVTAIPAAGLVAVVGAFAYRYPGSVHPLLFLAAGFTASALKTKKNFATGIVAAMLAVSALHDQPDKGVAPNGHRGWLSTGGTLVAGAVIATLTWTVIHNTIALIDVADDPALNGLRQGPHTLGAVVESITSLIWPLTGDPSAGVAHFYSPKTLGRDAQLPFYALLASIPIAVGMSALFVSPRQWPHILGLLALGMLVAGGFVMAIGLMVLYDQDPVPTPRYGISVAPLLLLAWGGALIDRRAKLGLMVFAGALLVTTVTAMVT